MVKLKTSPEAAQSALLRQIKTNLAHVDDLLFLGARKAAAAVMSEVSQAAAEYHRLCSQPVEEQALIELLVPSPHHSQSPFNFAEEPLHHGSDVVKPASR